MNRKSNIIDLVVGYAGAMAGAFAVVRFNQCVLMALPLAGRLICMLVLHWLIALIPIALTIYRKEKLSSFGLKKNSLLLQVCIGLAIAAIMSLLFTLLPHLVGFGELVDDGSRYRQLWKFIFEFVYCIVSVSAVEEFVFRGYLYAKIRNVFGNEWSAVILSSVLFGLLHIFSGNIAQVCMTMLLGVVLCLCRLKIRHCTLLSLVIAHGVYDALISVFASIFLK